jgi:C-terminal processing protease CtpA/Prc
MKRSKKFLIPLLGGLIWVLVTGCLGTAAPVVSTAAPTEPAKGAEVQPTAAAVMENPTGGPVRITGTMKYTNEFVTETYYVEHAVMLTDMTGFVLRDQEWVIPVESQVLGYLKLDEAGNSGTYTLELPIAPQGTFDDVDQSGTYNNGVQIFAVGYEPNLTGSPFAVGDDREMGWPSYLASVKTDSENQDEVIGGKLLIWSADGAEQFPSGFGDDGLLFTSDDPVVQVSAGYTMVNLDKTPFEFSRDQELVMDLYEPQDIAIKDYSADTYTEAFNKMLEVIRKEYAFNGVPGKDPNYDQMVADYYPRIEEAEKNMDADAYFSALLDFVLAFKDGHVSVDGGDRGMGIIYEHIYYGYGLAVRELDNKDVIVTYVTPGAAAANAGVSVGDQIISINEVPVTQAIDTVVSVIGPYSTDFGERWDKVRFLFRANKIGDEINLVYQSASGSEEKATLVATDETDSFFANSPYKFYNPVALPVEFELLDSGIGYIRMNSNYDDLNLALRLFERALKAFEANEVTGVIIDLRENSGGTDLGVAGFFTDQEIPMGQLEYYSEKTGKFEPEGIPGKIYPNQNQYRFDKLVTLVNLTCYSACELEAYGLSQVPGMQVIGSFPTAGVEAETARGEFKMPAEITLHFPTGRFTLEDGTILIEGKGVQPTIKVPVDRTTVFEDDAVLRVAEEYILK